MTASATENSALDRECTVFCRYLIGQEPNEYVKNKYRTAQQIGSLRNARECPADAFLVNAAGIAPWVTKIVDAYTRVFRPFSIVRKKIVLLLAILECSAPTYAYLDSVGSTSIVLLFLRLIQRCLVFAIILLIGIVVILPAELVLGGSINLKAVWRPRNG